MCKRQLYRAPLTIAQILAWADAHFQRTGRWPTCRTGPVADVAGLSWMAIQRALVEGGHGLPAGDSLARLLAAERGVRNRTNQPCLTKRQILRWADAHRQRTGRWPTVAAGPIAGAAGETWHSVDKALRDGWRGLAGGSSLAQLLTETRGRRNLARLPRLQLEQIVHWIEAHYQRTGKWPTHESGPIPDAPGESWSAVYHALVQGCRGLPAGVRLCLVVRLYRMARLTAPRQFSAGGRDPDAATLAGMVARQIAAKARQRQVGEARQTAAAEAGGTKVLDRLEDLHPVAEQPWWSKERRQGQRSNV